MTNTDSFKEYMMYMENQLKKLLALERNQIFAVEISKGWYRYVSIIFNNPVAIKDIPDHIFDDIYIIYSLSGGNNMNALMFIRSLYNSADYYIEMATMEHIQNPTDDLDNAVRYGKNFLRQQIVLRGGNDKLWDLYDRMVKSAHDPKFHFKLLRPFDNDVRLQERSKIILDLCEKYNRSLQFSKK